MHLSVRGLGASASGASPREHGTRCRLCFPSRGSVCSRTACCLVFPSPLVASSYATKTKRGVGFFSLPQHNHERSPHDLILFRGRPKLKRGTSRDHHKVSGSDCMDTGTSCRRAHGRRQEMPLVLSALCGSSAKVGSPDLFRSRRQICFF